MNYNNKLLHEKTLHVLCDAILISCNNDVYQLQDLFQRLNCNVDLTRPLFLMNCLLCRISSREEWQIKIYSDYGRYGFQYQAILLSEDVYNGLLTLDFDHLKILIEYILRPINFVGKESQLNTLIEALNRYLIHDKLKLSYKGSGVILHKNNQAIQLFKQLILGINNHIKNTPTYALNTVKWVSEFLKTLHFIIITTISIIGCICYILIHYFRNI